MKIFTLLMVLTACTISIHNAYTQGCVAVRNMSGCSLVPDSTLNTRWLLSLNYRFFESYKHFRGKHEEKERVENGTQVINHDNSIVLGAAYRISKKWMVAVSIPWLYIDRSSLYEHKGNSSGERYSTSSRSLGDVRISGYYQLFPNHAKVQLSLGLGIKLPTGNYNYKDYFHKTGSQGQDTLVLQAVDQSIQPGDGGTGAIAEADFTYRFNRRVQAYTTGMYMANPRNTNGTLRSQNLVNNIPRSNELSVADQFLVRTGARVLIANFMFSAGIRYEGIPVEDLIGLSDGFRRPGYILSAEPGIAWLKGRHTLSFNVPVALERNRTQSVLDKKRTEITGNYVHGDAAFADYLIALSYSCRL